MIAWPAKALPHIRPIGAERSAECAAIHALSFARPWEETDFEQLLLAPGAFADGAIDDKEDELAGFVLSRIAADEAEILTLAIAPQWRRRGVGTSLLTPHLAGLAAKGVARLFLEVDAANLPARALYAKLDFKEAGERKAYYRGEGAETSSALVMRRDLL